MGEIIYFGDRLFVTVKLPLQKSIHKLFGLCGNAFKSKLNSKALKKTVAHTKKNHNGYIMLNP